MVSTRFKNEFLDTQKRPTLEANFVISAGLFGYSGDIEVWKNTDDGTITTTETTRTATATATAPTLRCRLAAYRRLIDF